MKVNEKKLELAMAKKGYSFFELSKQSSVSRPTLSYIKNGKSCSPVVVNKIATALNVDVTEIIETEQNN